MINISTVYLERLSKFFFGFFLISFPLSVTASQAAAVASIVFTTLHKPQVFKPSTVYGKFFVICFCLYASFLLSLLWNIHSYIPAEWKKVFLNSELSDVWMCFIIPIAGHWYSQKENKKWINFLFYFSFCILTISGFVAIFTEVRLAKYFSSGFQFPVGERPQHFAGEFFGRFTYLPIGFMSTHLTFGGILSLVIPGIIFSNFFFYRSKKFFILFLSIFLSLLSLLVFFYNQSRSAWIGVIFVFFLYYIKFHQYIHKKLSSYKVWISILIFACISGLTVGYFIKKNWLLERAFKESLKDNTTENQRYFIYRGTLQMIAENFWVGVGPGRFKEVHQMQSDKMIEKNEQLWYELFITPRTHAHFDFLHFFSIGGFLSAGIFLYLWYYLLSFFICSKSRYRVLLFSGVFGLLPAGFFQCYLLDDEVALPFYALCGLLLSSSSINSKNKQAMNSAIHSKIALPVILTVFPFCAAIFGIVYKNRFEPYQVYHRKIWVENLSDKQKIRMSIEKQMETKVSSETVRKGFTIEGCLTHRFTKPISPRKENFSVGISIPSTASNYPTVVKIHVIERDAFDQDQQYKAHKTRFLKEFVFPLQPGNNRFVLKGILSDAKTKQFPENIFFRDFRFFFTGYQEGSSELELPIIHLGNLCDG
jgi:hypothetical protein